MDSIRLKECNICRKELPITNFSKKGKNKFRSYCKNCKSLKNEMLKAKLIEPPELVRNEQIEVRGKMSNGHKFSCLVSYEKATQMVNEKVAYIVNPKLVRKYFDKATFRKLVFKRYGNSCFYCGDEATTIDHIVPKSQGGISSFSNCVPACSTCNNAKGSMSIDEFLYYYDLSTTIPGMSRIDSVRYSLMEIVEKLDNINVYLGMCLQKIETEESIINDLAEMEWIKEKVNEVNESINSYTKVCKPKSLV